MNCAFNFGAFLRSVECIRRSELEISPRDCKPVNFSPATNEIIVNHAAQLKIPASSFRRALIVARRKSRRTGDSCSRCKLKNTESRQCTGASSRLLGEPNCEKCETSASSPRLPFNFIGRRSCHSLSFRPRWTISGKFEDLKDLWSLILPKFFVGKLAQLITQCFLIKNRGI